MVNPLDRDETPARGRSNGLRDIEGIAIESGLPANLLLAVAENAPDADGALGLAREMAAAYSPRIRAGEDIQAILRAEAPDHAEAIIGRARQIGEQIYPEQMRAARDAAERAAQERRANEPGLVGDIGRAITAGAVEGLGSAVEGAGILADQPLSLLRDGEVYKPGMLARGGAAVGDAARRMAEGLRGGMSEGSRQAMADSTPDGDLLDPSTWSAGDDPSPRGYLMHFGSTLGSLVPVIATGVAGRVASMGGRATAMAAGAVGGAQAAGDGAGTAAGIIEEAFQRRGEDGRSELEATSPLFQELRAQGRSEEEAFTAVRDEAARFGAMLQAPIGALSGGFMGAAARGLNPVINRMPGGPLSRAMRAGMATAFEEGFSEAAEGSAARLGAQVTSGMDVDLTEGTFGDFVLGAMGGGPVGAIAGAAPGAERHAGGRDDRGTGSGVVVSPEPAAPGGSGEGVASTPIAEPAAGRDEQLLARVRVQLRGERQAWDGEIIGETDDTVQIRAADGQTYDVPRSEIESGDVILTALEGGGPPPAQVDTPPPPAADRPGEDFGIGGDPEPEQADSQPMTTDDARRLLEAIEARARRQGWDDEMTAAAAQLKDAIERGTPADPALARSEAVQIGRSNGAPFGDEASARRGLGALGISAGGYDVVPVEGGYVARPKLDLRDGMGRGDARTRQLAVDDGGASRRARIGAEPVIRDGGDDPVRQPTLPTDRGGVPDATAPGEHVSALNVQQNKQPKTQEAVQDAPMAAAAATPVVENIRANAAVLRGVPQDAPPSVPGVSLKWDDREAGFTFNRKHVDAVRAAAGVNQSKADSVSEGVNPEVDMPSPSLELAPQQKTAQERERRRVQQIARRGGIKAPLAYSIRRMGGIAPTRQGENGERVPTFMAAELRYRGITPRTHPYLFNKSGGAEFDNIAPGTFGPHDAQVFGLDDTGNYLDRQAILDRLVDEVTGRGATSLDLEDEAARREADRSAIDQERYADAATAVDGEVERLGLRLLAEEKEAIISAAMGGLPLPDAIYDVIVRSALNTESSDVPAGEGNGADGADAAEIGAVPFGDEPVSERGPDASRRAAGSDAAPQQPSESGRGREARRQQLQAGGSPDRAERVGENAGAAIQWMRERAKPLGDPEIIEVSAEAAAEDGIEPGRYLARWFLFKGVIPASMKAALRGHQDRKGFADSEFIRFGNTRSTERNIEYSWVERSHAPASTTDRTDAGDQSVIPGAERAEEQARQQVSDRQRAEIAARQQQSKMRRAGGNEGAAGPLFDTQGDLLDAPEARPAPAPKQRTTKAQREREARLDRLSEYFAPGNIVRTYGGGHDRVIGFGRGTDGEWSVRVQAVSKRDGEWVAAPSERVRTHSTDPEERDLRAGPVVVAEAVTAAAKETDPNPTPAQAEAENYRTGKAQWNGLTLSVENAKGSTRRGIGPDGTEWSVEMPAHYGRILGTKGADGDHVDFYMGDDETSDFALIVNQIDPSTGSFDEHKVILGARDRAEAMRIYERGFSDGSGPRRVGSSSEHTLEDLRSWLDNGDMKSPTVPVDGSRKAKIQDFGEKIGGARKDTAEKTGPRAGEPKKGSETPGWRNRYEATQIVKSSRAGEEGKWRISDKRASRGRLGNGSRQLFDTQAEAEAAIPLLEVSRNHSVYGERGAETFGIFRNVTDRKRVLIRGGFAANEDAMRYMAQNAVEIIETKTRIDDSIHPALDEAVRIGDERRAQDRSVSDLDFQDVFGFRGVEFGNWNNNAERQHLMNQAFDAFLDLAEILQVPPRAISLNGDLSLAFGARGSGISGARAHYERDYAVINLTKIKGAGSLAHEWWHAVDHYLGRQDGKASSEKIPGPRGGEVFKTSKRENDYSVYGFQRRNSGAREEIRNAIQGIVDAMMWRKAEFTEDISTRERIAERQTKMVDEKLKSIRSYLATEQRWGKKKAPATAEQLARFDAAANRISDKRYGEIVVAPTKSQAREFRFYEAVMDIASLHQEVRGRQAYGFSQNRKIGAAVDLQMAIETRDQAEALLADAEAQRVKEKRVRTEYFSEAWRIDQGSATNYWSTPHEMIARAFESYIYDRLKDVEARNDFLSFEKHNLRPEYMAFGVKPYPEGAERESMNAAFRRLFDALSTRETERGVEMYSRKHPDPVAILTGDELGVSFRGGEDMPTLRRAAQAWYLDNLAGQTAITRDGVEVRFTKRGMRKSVSGNKGDTLLRSVPAIRAIVEKGLVVFREPGRAHVTERIIIAAPVSLAGKTSNLAVSLHRTADGTLQYDFTFNRDAAGRSGDGVPDGHATESRRSAFEGTPSDVNISLWPGEINADKLLAGMAASVTADLERAWSRLNLPDSARLRVVDRLFGMGQDGRAVPVDGSYLAGLAQVALDSAEGSLATLHHEAIHALRDPILWGQPHGLFTEAEWTGLEREARRSWATKHRIAEAYPDLKPAAQIEEAIAAEFAARSRAGSEPEAAPLRRALRKVRTFLRALGRALRGAGVQDADAVFGKIMSGEIGRRGSPVERNADGTFASHAVKYSRRLLAGEGPVTAKAERGIIGQMLTDAMGGKSSRYSILALVPGEPLYQELAKDLGSARTYLRLKHDMSAMRNHMQAEAAKVMDQWRGFLSRNRKANDALMDLMHDATKAGLDPAAPFSTRKRRTRETQAEFDAFVVGRRIEYEALRKRWDAMPARAQEIYRKVRDSYVDVARTEREIIEQNISDAMAINLKRARQAYEDELTRIDEDGLEGDERMEAEEAAAEAYAAVKKRDGYGRASRLRELRKMLESNQVEAPYFPLLRHGQYFVTVKDSDGRLVSFTKAESEREQARIAAEAHKEFAEGHEVTTGLMGAQEAAPDIDPLFVADVEKIIGQSINDPALMDAIWQRYLESMPDFSIRKSRLHRKGTPGYSRDAFRNFARQMFHSAHQLARLKHGMKMQLALDDAEREAQRADDPNRAMAIVNEMGLRHDWIMNPKTAAWSTWATGAAFIYYLGVTPAAALVNLSQTVIVGIPVLAAAFKKGGALRASRHLMRALKEFGTGRGAVENAKTLTDDERAAIREAYDRGIVDKSQAHDLAGVAESGVEYSDLRQRVMAPISFLFHHTERLNREITFIAAYRMARQDGLEHGQAIDKAGSLTWKTHFNYESDSRPRVQQNDFVRVMTVFRNFQLNMLYRLFRDTHQAFKGKTPEERQMARAQLFGITGLMMLSAGVTGTWGYSLMMTLAGVITPGADSDDLEKELRNGLVNMLGADLAGMILKGVPGHLSGLDLTNRLGMPDLWFRSPDRQLEGDDLYTYWAQQFLGAVPGMAQNLFRGVDIAAGGDPWRGVETAAPKFIRDLMRGWRYSQDGVTTISGNTILERVPPLDALTQAMGFTPAQISERYEQNRWMMNENAQIQDARSSVLNAAWQDVRAGGPISARTMEQIATFNAQNPDYQIDAATIRRSVQSRRRGATETLGGVRLNNRIEARIRANAPVSIYGAAP